MKISLLVLPLVLANRLSENHLQKRRFFSNIAGSVDNALVAAGDNVLGSAAGDAGSVAVAGAHTRPDFLASVTGHRFGFLTNLATGELVNYQKFLSHLDNLLSTKDYANAKSFLWCFEITDEVYIDLTKLAVKKGDQAFLVQAINSKPRSVLGDLQLMKYARELARENTNSNRANYLSYTIAKNMRQTVVLRNASKNRYYDLLHGFQRYLQPSDRAEQLANKFLSEAKTEADQKVWRDILSDIQAYGRKHQGWSRPLNYLYKPKPKPF